LGQKTAEFCANRCRNGYQIVISQVFSPRLCTLDELQEPGVLRCDADRTGHFHAHNFRRTAGSRDKQAGQTGMEAMSQTVKRSISVAIAAALALSAAGLGATPALAAGHAKQAAAVANTDISAARHHRHYRHYRHYRRGGSAAAIGAFSLFAGTIAAIAASQRYRDDYYYEPYGYYAPYGYYGGGYGYYGGGYRYHGGRHFVGGRHFGGGGFHHFHGGGGHHGGGHRHR
jgi:hypothetical protein